MNTDNLNLTRRVVVGVQFLFVAFGATVLVPLLVGLDPATALFTAGIGTFIFHLVTKGKVPIFLGSSFAFIAPIIAATKEWGLSGALAGTIGVSLVYFVMSALVKWQGKHLLNRLFPPVVIGPVIILIGLTLSGAGVNMAKTNWLLAAISLATAIIVLTFGKGLIKLVPVVCGIVVGYIVAIFLNEVNFDAVKEASWLALPPSLAHFHLPELKWQAVLFMIPVAIAPVIEHIGDVYVVGAVAQKDFVKEPGLHRTLLGDGLVCIYLWRSSCNHLFRSNGCNVYHKDNQSGRNSYLCAHRYRVLCNGKTKCFASIYSTSSTRRHYASTLWNHCKRWSSEPYST